MNKEKTEYYYTYSAGDQEKLRSEVERIRSQYVEKSEDIDYLQKLRDLDQRVKKPAKAAGICFGVIGTLVMGTGMSLVLVWAFLIPGIIVGLLGIAMVAATYPFYQTILKKRKSMYADEIIELSNKLLK